jgi:ADP-ribose pyrophosphatase YjhB (NUDIX family)/predicted transcriptional regulator
MHEIRREILKKLSETKKARYSELKRKGLEGNVFSYHLKALIMEGYIIQKDGAYTLTSKGKHLADRVSPADFKERIQPKIITVIIIKKGDEYLLYQRKKQPFFGYVGFPYGKIHLEERIGEAAERELTEKSGFQAKLKYRGHAYFTVHDETELVSSMLCHVFTGTQAEGELLKEFPSGTCFWGKLGDFPKNKLLPGVIQMENLVKENPSKMFFGEYFLNTSDEESN